MSFLGNLTGTNSARKNIALAGDQSRMEQRYGYDDVNQMYAPLREAGTNAFGTLQNIAGLNGPQAQQDWYNNYVESPDVAFRRQQGINAIDNSSAARTGGVMSGGLLKRLQEFGTGVATQDLNSTKGLIERISNTGTNAIGATANARLGLSSGLASSFTNEGNQMANADLADGAFLSNLINSGARLAGGAGFNPFQSASRQPVDAWAGLR